MTTESADITLLGVRVDDVTMDETLARIAHFVQEGGPHQIVTVNPEFVMAAQKHQAFAETLRLADLAVPDGAGLALAARWTGQQLRGRVAGVELCERLAELSQQQGWSLFLLGAGPGIADEAAATLQRRFPRMALAGTYAGSPDPVDEPDIHQRILAAKPTILLVAYGAPAQDLWIARNQPQLQVPVAIGVGGSFDYLSGRVLRAPNWMRRLGLEWLFRLIRQPWRWKRIWTAVVRFPLAVWRAKRVQGIAMGL
jgi:N-acetylglucosaminyldiphosphoundecaprenol N-acetyl-beta-D-mannosaminyltransferase